MSRNYDNWERLVAAVLRREQFRLLCYAESISPSFGSSNFSSSFSLKSSFSRNPSFDFANPRRGLASNGWSLPFQTLAGINVKNITARRPDLLVFVEDSPFGFDIQTLLEAPSDKLGDEIETFYRSFVVSLGKDVQVVLKWVLEGKISDLEQRMKMIGSMNHDNLVNLRGYLLSDRKFFGIYDYFRQGSLSTMLYGERDQDRAHLDWDTRSRIAIGAARGLAHIHKQCGGKLVHGNLKASNIFLNSQGYGCVADLNLANFLHPSAPNVTTIRGYRPPAEERPKASQASDVYSFGVLLLELLGGKSPKHVICSEYGNWARYKVRDDWTGLVFDRGLLKFTTVKEEMQDMLNVALSCVEKNPENRTNMESVVELLEAMIR